MSFYYYILNKPFGYLCQFTSEPTDLLLGQLYDFPKDVYSVGRLDKDSEGLLLLTNDNRFKTKLLDPKSKHSKTYLIQVEGQIDSNSIQKLESGTIEIQHNGRKHQVEKAKCKLISHLEIPDRIPPIRFRATIPTSWIELKITEGKNRQVRKMSAAVGFPTLRLIRIQIGELYLGELESGKVREIDLNEAGKAFE